MFRRQLGLKASDYVTLTQYATEKVCGAQRAVERVANFVMRCFLNGIAYLLTCLRCQLLVRGESTTIESGRAPMASDDRKVSDDRILEGLVEQMKSDGRIQENGLGIVAPEEKEERTEDGCWQR